MRARTLTFIIIGILGLAALGWYIHLQRLAKLIDMRDSLALQEFDDAQEAMDWLVHYGRGAAPDLNAIVQQKRTREPYWPQQWRAAQVLAEIGDESSVDALMGALEPNQPAEVRAAAAQALGRLGAQQAKAKLIEALQDKDVALDVRCAAARALGRLGAADGAGPLAAALKERPPVLPETEEGGEAEGEAPEPPPDETIPLRVAACQALGQIGEPTSANDLIEAADPDVEPSLLVRREACAALGEIGSKDALPVLLEALKDVLEEPGDAGVVPDTDGDIRVAAAHSLGRIGIADPSVMSALEQAAAQDRHYWVRRSAQESLKRLR